MTAEALTLFLLLQPAQFRISAYAVPVDVFVSKDGKAVAGLAREDFEAYDDGKLQRIDEVSFGTVPVNVLLALDTERSNTSNEQIRPDRDYGLSWIKRVGKGRVFYIALGHTPTFFATPALAEHVLAGIQFALGDLEADATPSAKRR